MDRSAVVVGDGVAGLTCARLLTKLGWQIEVWGESRANPRTWVLDPVTCSLLGHCWDDDAESSTLLAGAARVEGRRVRWGGKPPVRIALPARSVRASTVTARLRRKLLQEAGERVALRRVHRGNLAGAVRGITSAAAWALDATGRAGLIARSHGGECHATAHRCMAIAEVALRRPLPDTWMESLRGGWTFLAPLPTTPVERGGAGSSRDPRGVVQVMLPSPSNPALRAAKLLRRSRDIGHLLRASPDCWQVATAAPAALHPPCGPGWIAVGDAAFSLDPLAGDGVGSALRSSVLAVAVLEGIAEGGPVGELLDHYTCRLQEAFRVHLARCAHFYGAAEWTGGQETWSTDLNMTYTALAQLAGNPGSTLGGATSPGFAYRLEGLRLVRLRT